MPLGMGRRSEVGGLVFLLRTLIDLGDFSTMHVYNLDKNTS